MGVRNTFSGLFLQPISRDLGWGREIFSLAVAVQNLLWGAAQPFVGYLTDRHGAARVLLAGALLYALGLSAAALLPTPWVFGLSAGVLLGLGIACTTYTVAYSVLGRMVEPSRRAWAFGVSAAAGSLGQVALLPAAQGLIEAVGWVATLLWLSALTALIAPLGLYFARLGRLGSDPSRAGEGAAPTASAREALADACGDRSFWLLNLGYFVCGFQVVFIGAHLAPYLADCGLPANVSVTALALIGLFNVAGTYAAGALASSLPKRYVLSAIYGLRSLVIVVFLALPLTAWSVYLFAAAIGLLWLSTVPPTNALVAQIYGARHLGLLGGIVFFSHQVGSFLGAWLGGRLFDLTGSYQMVWWLAIALGVFATVIHWPIDERALETRRLCVAR
ncbi:MAG: MFS transporter [Casimicrobiaceae bacterium]|nr:MFS transporter [Casimicrobiaceae bacterium]